MAPVLGICTSYAADVGVIALFAGSGVVSPLAWIGYAAGAALMLTLLLLWGAGQRAPPVLRRTSGRFLRLVAVALQLGFALLNPPLTFYFLGIVTVRARARLMPRPV